MRLEPGDSPGRTTATSTGSSRDSITGKGGRRQAGRKGTGILLRDGTEEAARFGKS